MHSPHVTWYRPEYQGREDELTYLAQAARDAGVTRAALSNWISRHPNFPKIVMEVDNGAMRPTKWVVRAEFEEFARRQKEKPRGGPRGDDRPRAPRRPSTAVAKDRVAQYTRRIATLTEREEEQAAVLARTRAELRVARTRLEKAQAVLDGDIEH
ncbi:hypothetical protein HNR23_002260 [Nocardiopsis mwathae]|uniref:Uncharacterized protein n=1 Tax=Nocardiopsis mwathae TaxID=1472723 RepID=A0A7W9YHS4_9ACTN|nr:hypothetical protein [Nocardiopsis mwathae]MBB6172200.1 hypothetical protein [Nocardiopsis mwathae]